MQLTWTDFQPTGCLPFGPPQALRGGAIGAREGAEAQGDRTNRRRPQLGCRFLRSRITNTTFESPQKNRHPDIRRRFGPAEYARSVPISSADNNTGAKGDTWVMLTAEKLEPGVLYEWAVHPSCGAIVLFSGTVRDHAEGRSDVQSLTYEAYESQVVPRFETVVTEARAQWPDIVKVAVHHRIGNLNLGESSVLVVVSSPHRPEAFEAARFLIDILKASIPIWKKEHWADGNDWGTNAHELVNIEEFKSVGGVK